jgi:hypothetical protein
MLTALVLALAAAPAMAQSKTEPKKKPAVAKPDPKPVPLPKPVPNASAPKPVPPILRYNTAAEWMYLLETCGALTPERRAWLENVRGHAALATEWDKARLSEHDAELRREFSARYPSVPRERCEELARNLDNERATTIKVPLS